MGFLVRTFALAIAREGAALIAATHDPRLLGLCRRRYHLREGRIARAA